MSSYNEWYRLLPYLCIFDTSSQVEMATLPGSASDKEIQDILGLLGGGEYQVYEIPAGFRLIKVEGRTDSRPLLRITLESLE